MRCKAELYIADDCGDNEATIHCQLEDDHKTFHVASMKIGKAGNVIITWEKDARDMVLIKAEARQLCSESFHGDGLNPTTCAAYKAMNGRACPCKDDWKKWLGK